VKVAQVDFVVDGKQIIPTPVKPLQALRGSVTSVATGGIAAERRQAKQAVAERVVEEAGLTNC
jgi:hypothetical protein